jgi:hypothetical protein
VPVIPRTNLGARAGACTTWTGIPGSRSRPLNGPDRARLGGRYYTGWLPAPCHWPAGSLRAIHGGGLRRRRLPWPCVEQRTAMSPPRPVSDRRPRFVTSRLVPRSVLHRPARPARCAGASMKGKAAVGAGAAGSARPGGGQGRGGCFAARWVGGAARGRPCAGNAASELHAQPALPRAAPAPAPATQDGPGDAAGHRIYPPAG